MIEIKVDASGVDDAFERLVRGLQDTTPLMREVSFVMLDAVSENFEQGGRPKWLGKKSGEPSKLQQSGRLRNSVVRAVDKTSATVGTNLVYAGIHQLGGKTKPHVIKARNKKALRFGGRFVKSVNHPGSKIPARPYLVLTEPDNVEIELVGNNYLRRLLD